MRRELKGLKWRGQNDGGAGCCWATGGDGGASATMGGGVASLATTDDGVASVATGGCTGWMGGGELSDSRLWLGLVATFCSANLGSSACCSGSGGLFWRMSVWLDGRICLALTLEREMCSYLAELAGRDSSVSDGGRTCALWRSFGRGWSDWDGLEWDGIWGGECIWLGTG